MNGDPLELETLIAGILTMYEEAPVGIRAQVEGQSALIRSDFRRRETPVTPATVRAYLLSVMFGGMAAGIGPEPTRASNALGFHVAGACLLYRTVKGE